MYFIITPIRDVFCSMWRFIVNRSRRLAITYLDTYIEKWSIRMYPSMNSPRVMRLTKNTVFKEAFLEAHEAETMRMISQNTSIPIPKVIDHWIMPQEDHEILKILNVSPGKQDREAIVMEWVPGKTLESVWPSLNDGQKSHIAEQLKRYISELRSLAQPKHLSGRICSLNGGSIFDPLIRSQFCGPFNSEHELNDFCLARLAKFSGEPVIRARIEKVRDNLTTNHRIVFTHSDLVPRNILVDDQNNIVSILDWEMAGWKPEQWEYLKTMWMGQYDEGWPPFVHRILPDCHDQLELHNEMRDMHGWCPF